MKKIIFLLFVGIILFACSNDDKESNFEQDPKGLVFEIAAKTQLDETKAGAPVYSQDAAQNITRVSILAFKSDGTDYYYTKTYDITDWTAGSTSRRFVVPEADEVSEGDYMFMAIGRDATDLYQITPTLSGTVKMADVTAAISAAGDEYELFGGTAQEHVYPEGARVDITMTRKIAGVLGYFKNVPQLINGQTVRYLRLSVNAGNREMYIASGTGYSRSAGYDIINIDLSSQTVSDGIYNGNDLSAAGVVKLANSQLSGAYMLPIDNVTFTLGLYDENNLALKTWQVSEGGSTAFNIQPNHFYSLGVKHKPDTTTGTDPDPANPGDDDNAIDLLEDQVIVVTIDPAWNTIHSLILQ